MANVDYPALAGELPAFARHVPDPGLRGINLEWRRSDSHVITRRPYYDNTSSHPMPNSMDRALGATKRAAQNTVGKVVGQPVNTLPRAYVKPSVNAGPVILAGAAVVTMFSFLLNGVFGA